MTVVLAWENARRTADRDLTIPVRVATGQPASTTLRAGQTLLVTP